MRLIPLREHPSNLDPTARIVYDFGRPTGDCVFSVKGGFMAVIGMDAVAQLLPSIDAARILIAAEHGKGPWQWKAPDGEWSKPEPSRSHAKCEAMRNGNDDYELRRGTHDIV